MQKKVVNLQRSADPLIESLMNGRFHRLMDEAKLLRGEGLRGAILFELLGLLGFRRPTEREQARGLLSRVRMDELYRMEGIEEVSRDALIRAADWVLDQEFPHLYYRQRFNPALRVQVLAVLQDQLEASLTHQNPALFLDALDLCQGLGLSEADRFALLSEYKMAVGDVSGAFFAVREALSLSAESPLARRAAHALFQRSALKERVDLLVYSGPKQRVRSYGVSPFEGLGFLVKEYTGAATLQQRSTHVYTSRPPLVPPIKVMEWRPGWNPNRVSDEFWQKIPA